MKVMENNLSLANEANSLKLITRGATITPFAARMFIGVKIHLDGYNTYDLLRQLLEEYGEEKLIKKIKELQ